LSSFSDLAHLSLELRRFFNAATEAAREVKETVSPDSPCSNFVSSAPKVPAPEIPLKLIEENLSIDNELFR
jgi:hypothetical protein